MVKEWVSILYIHYLFTVAIWKLTSMSKATWKSKMDVYKRWGWSGDQIQTAFRKCPCCMTYSEKKIMEVMDFLVNEVGYDSLSTAENPKILNDAGQGIACGWYYRVSCLSIIDPDDSDISSTVSGES
ncbi:hypothetical protein C5167_028044 [Papaver somniferum]|nr:hypothetical protein C5167_028044 [Papaver somniferum]